MNKINKFFYENYRKNYPNNDKEIKWWHKIELPNGETTPGIDKNIERWNSMESNLPSFKNKSVLDIGAWDGFFSFKAESLGASKVLATDHFCWSGPGWGNKQGFDYAHKKLNSKVEYLDIDIPDIDSESVGTFDIVMMFGVLYHLPSFLTSFVNISSCAKEYFLVETLIDLEIQQDISLVRLMCFNECSNDHTNWFLPNPKSIRDIMNYCGFKNIQEKIFKGTDSLGTSGQNSVGRFFGQRTN